MNEISAVIDTLQSRIQLLVKKYDVQEKASREMVEEMKQMRQLIARQDEELKELKSANETLRHANSLLGSEENKRDTKLKINALIREIDHCIAQLAD